MSGKRGTKRRPDSVKAYVPSIVRPAGRETEPVKTGNKSDQPFPASPYAISSESSFAVKPAIRTDFGSTSIRTSDEDASERDGSAAPAAEANAATAKTPARAAGPMRMVRP